MCTSKSQDTYAYIVSVTRPVDSAQIETYIMFWLQYLLGSEDCACSLKGLRRSFFKYLCIPFLLEQITLSFAEFRGEGRH